MLTAALVAVLVTMLIVLVRAVAGPTLYDRLLAANSIGTKTVLFIALVDFVRGRPEFLDIAMVYAMINFIATVAVLKFMHSRDLSFEFARLRNPR